MPVCWSPCSLSPREPLNPQDLLLEGAGHAGRKGQSPRSRRGPSDKTCVQAFPVLRQACGRDRAQGRPRQGQAEPSGKALATETVSRPQQAQGLEVKARGGRFLGPPQTSLW